jgi:hypothetical protein
MPIIELFQGMGERKLPITALRLVPVANGTADLGCMVNVSSTANIS